MGVILPPGRTTTPEVPHWKGAQEPGVRPCNESAPDPIRRVFAVTQNQNKVFRKFQKRKKVNLSCPYYGHHQEESARAVSSFCRNCDEHFRIEKGTTMAIPGLRVAGIAEINPHERTGPRVPFEWGDRDKGEDEVEIRGDDIPRESWIATQEDDGQPHPLPESGDGDAEEPTGISAGAFFGLVEEEDLDDAGGEVPSIGAEAQGAEVLAEGSMEALIGENIPVETPEKEKMPPNYVPPENRKRASERGSTFDFRCFRCYHIQSVSRFAKSTQCERCSVYINLANYEVRAQKSYTLRTRGDITLSRKGGLENCEVACHQLTVDGTIDALVDCSGDATFRKFGIVRGHLYCRRIHIDKNCEVEFPDGVMAQLTDIKGCLKGDLTCSRKVRISRSGTIESDVKAVEIALKKGATVTEEVVTDPEISTELPVKKGTNPSIIG